VKKSWFKFDHFYSDVAFPEILPLVFADPPENLLDIGGNTGKWAIACSRYSEDVKVSILDLPGQIAVAKENIAREGLDHRVSFIESDLLDDTQSIPGGFHAIWMSQFLDCFSESEITSILRRCKDALGEKGMIYICETFWDRQRFGISAFSLQQISLYFTVMANGNSQMYDSKVFIRCIHDAGLKVVESTDELGISHTLLMCQKA